MQNVYRGSEIISELVVNGKTKGTGKVKMSQYVDVQCSSCLCIKRVKYSGHVSNRLKHSDRPYLCRECFAKQAITEYNRSNKGKSLCDRLGLDKANVTKAKISQTSKDRDSVKSLRKFYGMTWNEKFGREKADKMREVASKNCKFVPKFGPDNRQFGKPAHKLAGKGTKGYYRGIYFRSLLEASFIRHLQNNNIQFENGELRKYAILYVFEGRQRNYFSDFVTADAVYEIKPKSLLKTAINCVKFEAARIWCMNNNKKYIIKCEDDFSQIKQSELDVMIAEGTIELI